MRGMILIALVVCLFAAGIGVAVSVADKSATPTVPVGSVSTAEPTPAGGSLAGSATVPPGSTAAGDGSVGTASAELETPPAQDTVAVGDLPVLPDVKQPAFTLPINGLANVESIYSETHDVGTFTVRWRPGAFPPEKAAEVAGIATQSLATVNRKLGTSDTEPIDIFLADELFNEECWGCQGFAASDLRHVFILQDGSVSREELPALLTHEIGHVLAGTYIALPESLFFAEGLAVWLSDDDIASNGFISSRQSAAWALQAGVLPSIATLLEGDFAGRVRARAEYDAAASFAFFVIDSYGFDTYLKMYEQSAQNVQLASEVALGKEWETAEAEWHAYIGQWRENVVDGVTAEQFWSVGEQVMSGFRYLYLYPDQVSVDQYAAISAARLEWNRARLDAATALTMQANIPVGAAN